MSDQASGGTDGMPVNQRRPSPRRFKACRTCKRQKMKCDGQEMAPCRRCKIAGLPCIFDQIESSKRSNREDMQADSDRQKLRSLELELQRLRGTIDHLTHPPHIEQHNNFNQVTRSDDLIKDGPIQTMNDQSHLMNFSSPVNVHLGLASEDLTDPSAADNLTRDKEEPFQITFSPQTDQAGLNLWHDEGEYNRIVSMEGDLIERGLLPEVQCREMFERFFSRCSVFLPLFDTIFDSFDSLRSRSSFCFSAVLAVASQLPHDGESSSVRVQELCKAEAQRLSARTLFEGNPKVETVQAMTLLAAYSEHCWYAIGHAVRLAQQMHLDLALQSLMKLPSSAIEPIRRDRNSQSESIMANATQLKRQARVWITLCQLEQNIAFDTRRQALTGHCGNFDTRSTHLFHLFARHDLHILACIEILQLRGQFKSQLSTMELETLSQVTEVESVIRPLDECFVFWNGVLQDYGFPKDSFQANYIVIYRNMTELEIRFLILNGIKFSESTTAITTHRLLIDDILSHIVTCFKNLFMSLFEVPSSYWHFKSSPVYYALKISSTIMIALNTPLTEYNSIHVAIKQIAHQLLPLLQCYPFSGCHTVVEAALDNENKILQNSDRVPFTGLGNSPNDPELQEQGFIPSPSNKVNPKTADLGHGVDNTLEISRVADDAIYNIQDDVNSNSHDQIMPWNNTAQDAMLGGHGMPDFDEYGEQPPIETANWMLAAPYVFEF